MRRSRGVILFALLFIFFMITALLATVLTEIEGERLSEQNLYQRFHRQIALKRLKEEIQAHRYVCQTQCQLNRDHLLITIRHQALPLGEEFYQLSVGKLFLKFYLDHQA